MEMYGDSPDAARKASFALTMPGLPYYKKCCRSGMGGDPHGYELCIDASIGEDAAANLICDYINRMGTY